MKIDRHKNTDVFTNTKYPQLTNSNFKGMSISVGVSTEVYFSFYLQPVWNMFNIQKIKFSTYFIGDHELHNKWGDNTTDVRKTIGDAH